MTENKRTIYELLGCAGALQLDKLLSSNHISGAILMCHRIKPKEDGGFRPNAGLEISPEQLQDIIVKLKSRGYVFTTMDEVPFLLSDRSHHKKFAILTSDDGYRDNLTYGLPILQKHQVPLTIYVVTGFAERTSRMWWVELEDAIRRLPVIRLRCADRLIIFPCQTDKEKRAAFGEAYTALRGSTEDVIRREICRLSAEANIDHRSIVDDSCLDVDELIKVARTEPLIEFGSHTSSHYMLSHQPERVVWEELTRSRDILSDWIGKRVKHVAYPFGDEMAVTRREINLARQAGYITAVLGFGGPLNTRSLDSTLGLPRIFVNGTYASGNAITCLASGFPYAFGSRSRRLIAQ